MDEPGPIDPSHWLNGGPVVTPERAAKGDLFTGPDCQVCHASGNIPHPGDKTVKLTCRTCKGRGWVGTVNAASVDSNDIRHAQVQVRNILNLLHEREVLDDQHVRDGQTFECWQMWFTAELSCRPSTIYSPEMRGIRRELAEDDLAHDDYGKLIRGMSRKHLGLVERAIKTHATEHNAWLACRDGAHYRDAFDRLGVVMERLRAEFKARREAKTRQEAEDR